MNLSKDRKKLIFQAIEAIKDLNKDEEGNVINEYISDALADIEIALDPIATKQFIKLLLGEADFDFEMYDLKDVLDILEGDEE